MKKYILLFVLPLLGFANANPPEKEVTSEIIKSTVYLTGAQIERNSAIILNEGTTTLTFTNLSPFVDENSIQIAGLQSASITSVKYGHSFLFSKQDNEKISTLKRNIEAQKRAVAVLESLLKGLNEEETLLTSNRKLQASDENVSLEKLQQFATYYRKRIAEIHTASYDYIHEKDSIITVMNSHAEELNNLSSKNKEEKGVITLTLSSDRYQKLNLKLTYNVANAGWFPVYDLKTNATDENLDIYFKAHVYQDTGEDWNNVKVILSTADPKLNTQMPTIKPHYLNFTNPYQYRKEKVVSNSARKFNPFVKKVIGVVRDENGEPLPGANVIIKGTSTGTQTDFDGKYAIDVTQGETLEFSFLGFESIETPIYASIINANLQMSAEQLDEVVVSGYGVSRAISGRVPGVQIRGAASNYDKPSLLYILDGVPVDEATIQSLSENEIANMTSLNGNEATGLYGSRAAAGVIVITTKEVIENQNITSTEYTIKKLQNIPSLMEVSVIEIDKMSVQPTYEYVAAPVLNENVFLTASIKNWQELNLLPAESNIYFSGVFVGKSYINPYQTEDEMVISLGVAPSISVKRELDSNLKSKNFIGNNRVVETGYVLKVSNNSNKPINLKLLDRIPVSQNKEIKVDEVQQDATTYDEKKGILTWNLNLQPNENTEKHLSYEIKFPKGKRINL